MLDITKWWRRKLRTRYGQEVRLYSVDSIEPFSIHGAIHIDGNWVNASWTPTGHRIINSYYEDLVNVDE